MPQFEGIVKNKLPLVGTTIFSVMSKLALECNAINLSQGFPDFDCNPKLTDLVSDYMKKGFNQYAPMPGIVALRERLAIMIEENYGAKYNVETEITITAGATQAIYTAITALIGQDDEVIVFEPAYDCYVPAIELNGGKPVFVTLNYPDYKINWAEVSKLITHRTKMIIINSPHNPSGTVLSANDLIELERLTNNTDIIVLSDEVYEFMAFDGKQHESVARNSNLQNRSVIVSSFGKTVHTTGWKIGYVVAPTNLMAEFRKVHQFLVFSCNTPIQYALSEFLKDKDNYLQLSSFYETKRNLFSNLVSGSKFNFELSAGTYFQLLNYKNISEENDADFAVRITKDFGIASIPLSVFYHNKIDNKVLRFCFAKKDDTLKLAAEKICNIK